MGDELDSSNNLVRLRLLRAIILFCLGVVLIWDSAFGPGNVDRVIELTVGLVLVGVVPIDLLLERILRK